ncbi:hypothetical protein N8760_07190 [Rhodobacteraceae bacterium]|nr:hypothetical protein [Paracoccaceae bacterium]
MNEVTELEFSYLDSIPKGPLPNAVEMGFCDTYAILDPKTLSGIYISEKGWRVLSEQPIGPFEFVSFAGEFQDGLSGSCIINQANVAIFKFGELIGVIYTNSKEDQHIGKLSMAEGGIVQLSSPRSSPWVDIKILKDQIKIKYRASVQSFCDGSVIVPNIIGKQISEARKSLIEFAWEPIIQTEEVVLSFVERMRQSGIVETIDCGGTGMGHCSFKYESPKATLWVQSAGDEHRVLYHSASCK